MAASKMPGLYRNARLLGVHPAHLADGVTEHRPAREVTVVTPWLRAMGAAVVLGAGAALLPYGPAAGASGTAVAAAYGSSEVGAEPASRSPSTPSALPSSSSAGPSSSLFGQPSRAENPPGEGREHPRRSERAEESRDTGPHGREQRREAKDEDEGAGADRTDRPHGPRPDSEESVSEAPWGDTTASREAVPVPSATSHSAAPETVASTEPVLRILPLGSGLVLIGLGFGLAFVALRMRQASG